GEGYAGEYSNFKSSFNAFDFRRIYIGYDHEISKSFDARFVLSYEGNEVTTNKNRTVFVKDAWIKWKNVFDKNNLSFGIIPTPGFSYQSEKFWEYRAVEKTLIDFRRLESSRDIGILLDGTFGSKDQSGYYFMLGNGSGTKLETNNDKSLYGEIYTNLANNKLTLDLFVGLLNSTDIIKTFIGYRFQNSKIGFELAKLDLFNSWSKNILGASLYLISSTGKNKKVFFRYDYFQSSQFSSTPKEHFATAGFDYTLDGKVHIIPNIWMNFFQNSKYKSRKKTDVVLRMTIFYEYR
ncbi:MAG: porin, partial [Ignavibacteria bacterium]